MASAGNGRRGGIAVGVRPVSEADRISLMDRLLQFRNETAIQEMTFEANLSNHDRAIVHEFCRKMGFKSKSHGKGKERRLTVYKAHVRRMKGPARATQIHFSVETQQALQYIFSKYSPADDGNLALQETAAVAAVASTSPEEKVTALQMTPEEIQKELNLLSHRRETMTSLRTIEETRQKLPIANYRDMITSTVSQNQVVIIAGETGCGKSTQVPQYILEDIWSQGKPCRVICTQPRRISATAVADRVACERGEALGETVGYQIRLESRGGPHSSLMFCTNGVLLRKLVMARENGVAATHIIVDEIHERDCNADFLLIILKELLLAQPNLRLILMSATLNAALFAEYFSGCPVLQIPGFTHPVTAYYLEDVLRWTNFSTNDKHLRASNRVKLNGKGSNQTPLQDNSVDDGQLVHQYHATVDQEEVDIVLIQRLLERICARSENGAILVFFPGWEDISACRERLMAFFDATKYQILSLHSMIPMSEQKKVFQTPPAGMRKIILATNIAETAITIDDVVYVVDSGRMKEKSYDPYTNVSTFQTAWISKASARQRQGRAGRCRPGVCYHLFSKVRAASLDEFQLPEIKRTPLEEVCLKVKLLQPNGNVRDFLAKALDPPLDISIQNAISLLKDIGAVTPMEELTELGQQLGSLPVHPSTTKMLLLAILLKCLDPALTIACAAGYREPFVIPLAPEQKSQASAARHQLGSTYGGYSDHLALVAAFEGWRKAKRKGKESRFCSENFLSGGVMYMLDGMRKQLLHELIRKGLVGKDRDACNENAHDPGVIRAVVAACMYPLVGRILPPLPSGQKATVQVARGEKARIHVHSANHRLESSFSRHLLVFDEITRGEAQLYIRNSTLIKPHPILFLCTELAVAPLEPESDEEDEDDVLEPGGKKAQLLDDPDNMVALVVDRWLKYETTSVLAAMIYCLRERLLAALFFKVKYPSSELPEMLSASIDTLVYIFSTEGKLDIRDDTTARQQRQYSGASFRQVQEPEPESVYSNGWRTSLQYEQRQTVSKGKLPREPALESTSTSKFVRVEQEQTSFQGKQQHYQQQQQQLQQEQQLQQKVRQLWVKVEQEKEPATSRKTVGQPYNGSDSGRKRMLKYVPRK